MADLVDTVTLSAQPFCLTFLTNTTFAAGLITGSIELHSTTSPHDVGLTLISRLTPVTSSGRCILSPSPSHLIAGSSTGEIVFINHSSPTSPQTQSFTATSLQKKTQTYPGISSLLIPPSPPSLLLTGDDTGVIRLFPLTPTSLSYTPHRTLSHHTDNI